ncbi:conserved hypothetical protein [Leishmania braziliensis MHOM/BR/75/M2904]|uniref:Uncharacterized protein n=2 Tax=Leishmania braziliensis TaxID=5660 RepID=A4HK96_LEIBR|nr:conserved hypothetical protein [Leishmania braziliensis MHOM/BR/75/M2904]CAJ2472529.1 unnamed protein product [Leishmania braziliensis]CAJ2472995.1 unnamed protein product [Leishmania braziliensis]CAM42919.1 conserved hypothetical protein [Leishmania braziliensis MHOM/BR/75/M2904]SYZ65714.1 hypothetical_protein [Leishmania braziliensis MHOM/BR/75/M2904]
MAAPPRCTLHIAVDTDLAVSFDGLLCLPHADSNCAGGFYVTPSAAHTTLFPNPPSRTCVHGVRQVNAVSQTVVLRLRPSTSHADSNSALPPALTSALTRNTYVVVVLDAQQVPQMLSAAMARRCPPHVSGAGPLGWYLDAVVESLLQGEEEEGVACGSDTLSTLTGADTKGPSTNQACATTHTRPVRRGSVDAGVVHMHMIVVPNATIALSGLNSTNMNITGAEAAALFSAATAWCAARRVMSKAGDVEEPLADCSTNGADARRRSHVVPVELGLCATAAHAQQATQMIAALGNKLLKVWSTSAAAVGSTSLCDSEAEPTSMVGAADVRCDTQRKVIPSDFHALYTSMLTEVLTFSERKAIAAVAAFPTMCHLLEYVDGIVASAPAARDGSDGKGGVVAQVAGAVYSTNYDEHRSWKVLNSDIIEALVTEYER